MATSAVKMIQARGHRVYFTPQNIIEFWNVATRPANKNGFGYTPAQARQDVQQILSLFYLAEDTPAVFPEWLHLVEYYGVSGVKVHDARLVAVMVVHGLTHVLTFNGADFQRFGNITVVDPRDVGGIFTP